MTGGTLLANVEALRSTAPRTSGSSPPTGSSAATRSSTLRGGRHHRHRRHRHGADRPAQAAGEPHCADRLGPPRRDDHERVRRRLGVGDLRRREPALLTGAGPGPVGDPFPRGGRSRTLFAVEVPDVQYAKSGDVNIAYQVTGDGPFDLVFVPGFVTHLELRLGGAALRAASSSGSSSFSRLIRFDKRGTGHVRPRQRRAHAGDAHGRRARRDGRGRVAPRRASRHLGGRP